MANSPVACSWYLVVASSVSSAILPARVAMFTWRIDAFTAGARKRGALPLGPAMALVAARHRASTASCPRASRVSSGNRSTMRVAGGPNNLAQRKKVLRGGCDLRLHRRMLLARWRLGHGHLHLPQSQCPRARAASGGTVCTESPTLLCTNSSSPRTRDMAAPKLSCVVIGGGVTGLALAHRLLVLGGGRIGVTVLEAQSRTGGWVQSHVQDGVLMEGGARSLRVPGERERVCVCACMCMHRPSHTAVQRGVQGGRRVRADEQWHACTHLRTHTRTGKLYGIACCPILSSARDAYTQARVHTHTHTHTHTRTHTHRQRRNNAEADQ